MSKHSTRLRRFRPWRAIAVVAAIALFSLTGSGVWAYWSAGSGAGGNGVASATTVGAGATPTVLSAGTTVNLNWAPSTLANGFPVTGYLVKRYNATTLVAQTILSSCAGTITGTNCTETSVPAGSWRYSITPVVGTNWTGAESPLSPVVHTDSTLPANSLSLSNLSGAAGISGTTIYYNGSAAGSLTITDAVTDTGSGPASSTTSALAGTTTGWTHSASTVSTPTGGPYVSNTFSWAAGTTSSPIDTVTGRDLANNVAATTVTFVNDSTAPTGTISYTNGYQAGRFVTVTLTAADSGSGLASAQLQRNSANLVNGVCQTFTAFSNLGAANPVSPYTDSTVTNAKCYNYRYVLTDVVGNTLTATSANTAWVDYAGAVRNTAGIVSQLRLGDSSLGGNLTAADSAGSNSATYTNGVVQGATGELPNDSNTAVTLDGTNDYIRAATTNGLPKAGTSRSVELWFKTSATTQQALFAYGTFLNDEEFGLWINAGGTAFTAWGWGGPYDGTFAAPASVDDGKWHQVVETYNSTGTVLTVYLDGASLGSSVLARNTVLDSYGLQIGDIVDPGDPNSGFPFKGSLDEFSIYSAALTRTDVTNHYQLGANTGADSTGPAGGSVSVAGATGTSPYSTSTTLNVTLSKGTDADGIAPTGALLFRASAPLTSSGTAAGVCGTYSGYALVATDPSATYTDTVADKACYSYEYAVPDTIGNYTTYSAATIIEVDVTPPSAPTLTFKNESGVDVTGNVVTYTFSRFGQNRFTVTAAATDTTSGIASYAFSTAPAGWTVTGSGAALTYKFATGASPGTVTITATNFAGNTSTTTMTLVAG